MQGHRGRPWGHQPWPGGGWRRPRPACGRRASFLNIHVPYAHTTSQSGDVRDGYRFPHVIIKVLLACGNYRILYIPSVPLALLPPTYTQHTTHLRLRYLSSHRVARPWARRAARVLFVSVGRRSMVIPAMAHAPCCGARISPLSPPKSSSCRRRHVLCLRSRRLGQPRTRRLAWPRNPRAISPESSRTTLALCPRSR